MIRFIPEFISHPIDRQQEMTEDDLHPFLKRNEEQRRKKLENLERIKEDCRLIRATCPNGWAALSRHLAEFLSDVYAKDQKSPMDFMDAQSEKGSSVDSNYWALNKAYLGGQIRILETLFAYLEIKMEYIDPPVVKKSEKKSLHFFKNLLSVFSRSKK